ncbi:MAG: arginine:pyruvate transaminase, partial [Halieaceae bacterium]
MRSENTQESQVTPFDSRFSQLAERLGQGDSGAWDVHARALKMKESGADVVMLSVGDPDFRTPDPIIDNAVSHMRVGRTHYSPALGEMNFRRAVADLESRTSPHHCSPDNVAIFPGGTSAIHAVMS